MNILSEILGAQNGKLLEQLAGQFGMQQDDTRNAVTSLLPAITKGLQNNMQKEGGIDSLLSALSRGGHDQYVDRPETLGETRATEDGNSILGHIFGSKDTSREVATQAANSTGLDLGILKKMLPVLAGAAMGTMNKQTSGMGSMPRSAADSGGGDILGGLGSFLDLDGDGSVSDDILDFVRKLT